LTAVHIIVTTCAAPIFELVIHVVAVIVGEGALVAGHAGLSQVSPFEAEFGLVVGRQGEQGRFETPHVVAVFAGSTYRSTAELPAVHVFVAVSAFLMRHNLQRVPGCVTFLTFDLHVQTTEREVRAIVIDLSLLHLPPASGVVTARTVLTEPLLVGVFVAIRALLELQPCVPGVGRIRCRRFVHSRVA